MKVKNKQNSSFASGGLGLGSNSSLDPNYRSSSKGKEAKNIRHKSNKIN